MEGPGRLKAGLLAAVLISALACSDDPPEKPDAEQKDPVVDVSGQDVTMDDMAQALGCDVMRGASYEGLRNRNVEPPFPDLEEEGRDCYRDGRFVGRVHVFTDFDAYDAMHTQADVGPPYPDVECDRDQLQVITGDRWAVVTRGKTTADEVQERIGGREVPVGAGSTTFVSYIMPCVGDPEPD